MNRLPQHLEQIFLMIDRHAGVMFCHAAFTLVRKHAFHCLERLFQGPMLVNLERRRYCECSEHPDSEKK